MSSARSRPPPPGAAEPNQAPFQCPLNLPWPVRLAVRELWTRRDRSLLSLFALALSTALVVATGAIGAAMRASVDTPVPLPSSLGEAAEILWVTSAYDADYDLPAGLQATIEAIPGVGGVQPVLRRPARVRTPRPDTLTLLGVDPAAYFNFHNLVLAAGRMPSDEAPGAVALAPWAFVRDLRLGQIVTVTTPSGDAALPLAGLVEIESLAAARQGLVLYVPLVTAADLFEAHDVVTAFEVGLSPGASPRRVRAEMARALGPAYAVSAASQPGQRARLWQRLVVGALLFVDGLTLLGSVALVYAVCAAAARARRRQMGLLRAAGALRRQVLALLVAEATLLGLAGSAAGVGIGLLFARVGVHLVLEGDGALPILSMPAGWLLGAVGVGVLGALAGAIGPAMRAAREAPVIALGDGGIARGGSHGHEVPLLRNSAGSTKKTSEVWELCVAQRLAGILPPEARLAAANLAREPGRAARAVVAMALILAMALGDVGVLSLLGEELATTFGRLAGGDFLVLPGLTTISLRELAGQDTSDVPPLDAGLLAALADTGDRVWLMRGTTADVEALQVFPGQPVLLLDVQGYARMGGFRFQAGNWAQALETFRHGPAVLLTPVVARRLNARLGDRVRLDTVLGPVDFIVAGIGDSEFTTCVLDLADGAAYFGANEVNGVEVQVRPGADPQAVRRALLDAVHTHGGTLLSVGQAEGRLRAMVHQVQTSIGLLIGVTGAVALLGLFNATMASVAERRREIGLLRAVGATRSQVRRIVRVEASMLGVAAAVAGTGLGWAVTFLFLALARAHLGLPGGERAALAPWLPLIAASAIGLILWPVLAALGALAPAAHASRLPVVQALGETRVL